MIRSYMVVCLALGWGCVLMARNIAHPYLRGKPLRACQTGDNEASFTGTVRFVKANDAKLKKEFEYLVFDLGHGVELKLVKVAAKGKTFTIGSSKTEQDAVVKNYFNAKRPAFMDLESEQEVNLSDDFYIGQFEVTRGQFRRFVEEAKYTTETEKTDGGYGYNEKDKKFEGRDKKYSWKSTGLSAQTDDYPVTDITRNDARTFCDWLGKKATGTVKLREVRLPGEAEWEFACRAGSKGRFAFGDHELKLAEYANVADATAKEAFPKWHTIAANDGYVFAAPVGSFIPNDFGLYDMHGNVWEWVEDYYGKYSALPKTRNAIQTRKQGEERPLLRGGAYYNGPSECRCAYRYLVGIGGRYGAAGFRVVCVP